MKMLEHDSPFIRVYPRYITSIGKNVVCIEISVESTKTKIEFNINPPHNYTITDMIHKAADLCEEANLAGEAYEEMDPLPWETDAE